jgi:glycosyltransferase involved in cell wall biosynthesis
MPRLLFVTHDYGRLGAQMMLLHLLRALRHVRPAWELRVVAREPHGVLGPEFEALAPCDVFWREGGAREPGPHQARIREALREWAPDLVYANTAVNGDVTVFLDLAAPVVVHVHEMRTYLDLLDPPRRRALVEQPAGWIACAHAVKDVLVADLALDASRIAVVHEAVDLDWIDARRGTADRGAARAALGLPRAARVVGSVGRIDARKGWDLFAAAARELLAGDDPAAPWHFVWLGHGPAHADLRAAFDAVHHGDRLLAPGARDNPFPYYAAMDFFAQTSREDPCPLTTIEAAYLGLPVVVFGPSGGAREVVGRGCGAVLPSIDAGALAAQLRAWASEPAAATALGARGPAIVRDAHDVTRTAARIAARLERLLGSGRWTADE